MSKSRRAFLILFSFIVARFSFPTTILAQAPQTWDQINSGRCIVDGDVATIQGFECLFYNILQVIVSVAGIAFFLMFISGGFQYLMSQNDPKKVAAASSTLTLSIVGVVGVIVSFFILKLIENFTGVSVSEFLIPGP